MTGRPEYGDPRAFDPDATVALPVIPPAHASGYDADATVLLPTVPGGRAPSRPPAPDEATGPAARASAVMAVGSIVSGVAGFLVPATIGAAIGSAAVSDDYNVANTLPNMVYELLLGGVLASVVVPLLVRARTHDADRGEAYA